MPYSIGHKPTANDDQKITELCFQPVEIRLGAHFILQTMLFLSKLIS